MKIKILIGIVFLVLFSSFTYALVGHSPSQVFPGSFQTDDYTFSGNLTIGERLTFSAQHYFQGVVDSWLILTGDTKIVGDLNVTGDIYATDIHTAANSIYIGDKKISSDSNGIIIDGKLNVSQGLVVGNTSTEVPGTIRWNGEEFQGYDGSSWVNLMGGNGSGVPSPYLESGQNYNLVIGSSPGASSGNYVSYYRTSARSATVSAAYWQHATYSGGAYQSNIQYFPISTLSTSAGTVFTTTGADTEGGHMMGYHGTYGNSHAAIVFTPTASGEITGFSVNMNLDSSGAGAPNVQAVIRTGSIPGSGVVVATSEKLQMLSTGTYGFYDWT